VVVVGGAIIFTGGTAAAGVAALTKKIGTGAIVTGSALVLGQGLADGFITGTESGFGAFFNAAMRGIAIGVVAGAVSAIPIKGKFISTKAASHISANLSGMAGSTFDIQDAVTGETDAVRALANGVFSNADAICKGACFVELFSLCRTLSGCKESVQHGCGFCAGGVIKRGEDVACSSGDDACFKAAAYCFYSITGDSV